VLIGCKVSIAILQLQLESNIYKHQTTVVIQTTAQT
jgi:hypothetical protein